MPTPYEEAKAIWTKEKCERTFEEDLHLHLLNGWVHCTPALFAMGRDVPRNADPRLIVNPAHIFPKEDCDCWHVYALAGDVSQVWQFMPWELPWASFERRNELRFYPLAQLRRLSL